MNELSHLQCGKVVFISRKFSWHCLPCIIGDRDGVFIRISGYVVTEWLYLKSCFSLRAVARITYDFCC